MSRKKIIIITAAAVAAAALITCLAVYLVSVFKPDSDTGGEPDSGTGGKPTLSVGSASGSAGETVRVPVKFTGNPGAMGFLFDINYDDDFLEYISFENGGLLSDCEISGGSGSLKLLSIEDSDVTDDGVIAYLTFRIRDEASGELALSLVCGENGICNYNEESIAVKTSDGKITVK